MKHLNRTIFISGLILFLNALVHFTLIKVYGSNLIDVLKKYDANIIFNYVLQLVKYEVLIGLIIVSLSSGIMILIPKKKEKKNGRK